MCWSWEVVYPLVLRNWSWGCYPHSPVHEAEGEWVFKNLCRALLEHSLLIKGSTPQGDLVTIYRRKLDIEVIERMGFSKIHKWTELLECCDRVEDVFALWNKAGPSKSKAEKPQRWGYLNNKKEAYVAEIKLSKSNNHVLPPKSYVGPSRCPNKLSCKYSFEDNKVESLLKLLLKQNKIQLLEPRFPDKVNKMYHPRYCVYCRRINHPTRKCYILKDMLHSLTKARVLKIWKDKKKVIANATTIFHFGDWLKASHWFLRMN